MVYKQSKKDHELVFNHGGFLSPSRSCWFKLVSEAVYNIDPDGENIDVYHWGDIDLGGFRMFENLKEKIFTTLKPYLMGVKTLEAYKERCLPLPSEKYADELDVMISKEEYSEFSDTIKYMLKYSVRLEQENIIW